MTTTPETAPITGPVTAPAGPIVSAPVAVGTATVGSAASDNAILAVSARAAFLRAQGVDVVSLAAGEPNTSTPAHIVEAAAAAALSGAHDHYGPAAGILELRQVVAERLPHVAPVFGPDDVQVTLGTKHALSLALQAVLQPTEEALLAKPGWPGHTGAAIAAGARPVPVPVTASTGFLATAEELEAARTPRTRAVVLASPANPSGAVYNAAQLTEIGRWALEHDVWVISDDVYAQVVYGDPPAHILSVAPQLRPKVIITSGVSKGYAMTGWRVGWLAGPADIVAAARRHVSRTITHVPGVNQAAAVAALTGDQTCVDDALALYRRNRDLFVAALDALPGVSCPAPAGGMFVFPDVSGLLNSGPWADTVELADWLLDEATVAVVPGEAFHAPGRLRLCFAISTDAADKAVRRLVQHLSSTSTDTTATTTVTTASALEESP